MGRSRNVFEKTRLSGTERDEQRSARVRVTPGAVKIGH
jgi:hypothetical protein